MKRLMMGVILTAGVLAPLAASADHYAQGPCGYTGSEQQHHTAGDGTYGVTLYADADGDSGMSGSADRAAGACIDGFPIDGSIEAGHAEGRGAGYMPLEDGVYVIADGENNNATVPLTHAYAGLSNYEYNDEDGRSTNSGGETGVNDTTVDDLPVACGSSSPDWDNANYDGCVYQTGEAP